ALRQYIARSQHAGRAGSRCSGKELASGKRGRHIGLLAKKKPLLGPAISVPPLSLSTDCRSASLIHQQTTLIRLPTSIVELSFDMLFFDELKTVFRHVAVKRRAMPAIRINDPDFGFWIGVIVNKIRQQARCVTVV